MTRNIKRNSVVFLVRQVLMFALSIIVNLYTTRQLGSYNFGFVVVFTSIVGAFSFLSDGGIWVGFIQGERPIDTDFFGKMFNFVLETAVPICLALIFASYLLRIEILLRYDSVYYIIGIILCTSIQSVYYAKMQRELKIQKSRFVILALM